MSDLSQKSIRFLKFITSLAFLSLSVLLISAMDVETQNFFVRLSVSLISLWFILIAANLFGEVITGFFNARRENE